MKRYLNSDTFRLECLIRFMKNVYKAATLWDTVVVLEESVDR